MCGICGIIDLKGIPELPRLLRGMNSLVINRGPDDEGLVLFSPEGVFIPDDESPMGQNPAECPWIAGLGHRRLSIIDLSPAGHQPMPDSTGRFWIVLNGEIYNYLEIRQELISQGVTFRSHSDTEVALASYIFWGEDCLNHFNGMWALAIYDRERQRLFCARDRFGVKPFYYMHQPERFAFGSEIKQLHYLAGSTAQLNPSVLADFLFWRFETHTEETFFEGILALPPGHFMEIDHDVIATGAVRPKAFWQPRAVAALDDQTAATAFRELLQDSVKLRLRSDVPVGVTLSGGLDSSSVTCLAATQRRRLSAEPLMVFTADFGDPGFSEERFARIVSERVGANHVFIRPESHNLVNDWSRFVRAMEEPFSGLSFYANWKVYQKIRESNVTVILNGQGGDELLLGYDRYRVPFLHLLARKGRLGSIIKEMVHARTNAGMSFVTQILYLIYFNIPWFRINRRVELVRPFLRADFFDYGRKRIEHVIKEMRNRDRIDLQSKEFMHYQLQHLLRHEDRVSMNHSIESRLPFLDYRLFEFILGQSDDQLIRNGWSKWILRESMEGILPEMIRLRRDKMGYDTPTGRMLQENRPFFEALLDRHEADSILNIGYLRKAIQQPRTDEYLLCSCLSYLSWKETFNIGCV